MKKKDCKAWQVALKLARRKSSRSKPTKISKCGKFVTFTGLVYGNNWVMSENEIITFAIYKGLKIV